MNDYNQPTFYFHDYETFGINPALDRPAQFAGIRTDADFTIIDEPLVRYCQLADDYLPQPEAVLLTGITPQQVRQKGICEAEFGREILQAFSQPQSCILGYNNIRFDDEVTRNILYRNFYDPYAYSWQHGNSRWDLLDVVRACYALRPEGIEWPINDEGLPSFKLEHLTVANHISHEQAHDAMSDVYATIAMAKLLKSKQPRLFNYFYALRHKKAVAELLDPIALTPLVHVSGMLGAYRGNTTLISPLLWHPYQSNAIIVCDLTADLAPLLSLTAEQLKRRLYTRTADLADDEPRLPLKLVHTNKCPILAPAGTLSPENARRLKIDLVRCDKNRVWLQTHQLAIQQKLTQLYSLEDTLPINLDVDSQIYQGFFNQQDKSLCQVITTTPPALLATLSIKGDDPRLAPLFFRYKARNYPASLSEDEQRRWHHYRMEKFSPQRLDNYFRALEANALKYQYQPEKLNLLKSLSDYADYLLAH